MESRHLLVALIAAMAVYFLYTAVYNWLVPPPPPRATPAVVDQRPEADDGRQLDTQPADPDGAAFAPAGAAATNEAGLAFDEAESTERVTLGGGETDWLEIRLTSIGASVESIRLTRKVRGRYVHAQTAKLGDPYHLVEPVDAVDRTYYSLSTERLWSPTLLSERGLALGRLRWPLISHNETEATFATTLRDADDSEMLRLTKAYRYRPGTSLLDVTLTVENLAERQIELSLEQAGAFGIHPEGMRGELPRLLAVGMNGDGSLAMTANVQRSGLSKVPEKPIGRSDDEYRFLWSALANKYFGVFIRPVPLTGPTVRYLQEVAASLGPMGIPDKGPGGVWMRMRTRLERLEPGGRLEYVFEVYAGSKDPDELKTANPAFASRSQIGYVIARDADVIACCPCQFAWLTEIMGWLLTSIHAAVRNYGVAIIVLVIIIRTLLHPLSVFQQKSMYKATEAMAKLQPKMLAIREKYANDRAKMNQETMKLYADEGVNPAAPMVGMIPLFLQMPILIALWTALSSDVHLRHAPFDGWWIKDLSSPDAFLTFNPPGLTIPILGWLIPFMFANIPSLNLLPVLMGISMWLQQKYMPKPHMDAKIEAAKKAAASAPGPGGMTPADQLRQQQMIAYMMSIMFPLMFYYMPSGLSLYWLATNVFGVCESLIIRRQIRAEKERREREGPTEKAPVKKSGWLTRMLQNMAEQAEEMQKKADDLSERDRAGRVNLKSEGRKARDRKKKKRDE